MQIITIGVDLAKSWFQVHGVDANGKVAVCRKLKRGEVISFFKLLPPCLVGIEACATAHYWARGARRAIIAAPLRQRRSLMHVRRPGERRTAFCVFCSELDICALAWAVKCRSSFRSKMGGREHPYWPDQFGLRPIFIKSAL